MNNEKMINKICLLEGFVTLYLSQNPFTQLRDETEKFKYDCNGSINMTKLPIEFYARKSDLVARDLLGRYIYSRNPERNVIKARLRSIWAYEGVTKKSPEGIYLAPGISFISIAHGHRLLHISTGKKEEPSCLTLKDADFETLNGIDKVKGPGNLAKRLGINLNTEEYYNCREMNGRIIWIEGESVPEDIIEVREGNSENSIGLFTF